MVDLHKWTERDFNFDFPKTMYPAILERLSGTAARLEQKIDNAPFMILTQPYKNGWSIQEHAGHLIDLEDLLCARLDDYEAREQTLTAADMSNKKTYDANYNDEGIKTILKTFRIKRAATIKRLMSYDEATVERTSMHPRLNTPMRLIDIAYFFAEHDDHHLASINKIVLDFD